MSILKDHADEAFGLSEGRKPEQRELLAICYDNLRFHTQGNESSRTNLITIAATVDGKKMSDSGNGQKYCRDIRRHLEEVRATDEAKSAAVAVIAAHHDVLHQCVREFPTPGHSNLFANHAGWRKNLDVVGQVLRNNAEQHIAPSAGSFVMPAPTGQQ